MPLDTLRYFAAAVLLSAPLFSCERGVRKPAAAPSSNVTRPVAYIPADVDLVMRLDVGRFRDSAGLAPEVSLVRLWEDLGPSASQPQDTRAPLIELLKSCASLWVGCRITAEGCRDYVLVLRGQWTRPFGDYGFAAGRNKRDLGGGWLSHDFAAAQRSSIARLYWRPPDLAVLVSSAELDSAERSVEQSTESSQLEPSEDGVMSLVARSGALARVLRQKSPKGADWLERSERVEIRFDPGASATVATFTVVFDDEAQAKRSAQAFQILVAGLTGLDPRFNASNVLLQEMGAQVILRVSIPNNERVPKQDVP